MQEVKLIATGLDTNSSELPGADGNLVRAENVRILRDGIIQQRRGYSELPTLGGPVYKLFSFQNTLFAHYSNTTLKYYDGSAWQLVGSFAVTNSPTFRMRTAEANKNLYFTASDGTYKLTAPSATPALAGVPKALPFAFDDCVVGAGTFLADGYQVAYRHVIWTKDANGNKVVGAASGRMVLRNTTGAPADCTIEGVLPDGVTTDHYVTLYRSIQTELAVEPPDEMGRVYEMRLAASNISSGQFSITDSVPDDLRDETLYVSPSQEGILQSNDPPPLCRDLALYKGCLFYANTTQPQRFFLDILAVGGSTGIQSGDTFSVGGRTYTAGVSYALSTSGSVALDNRITAQNLCTAINKDASQTAVYAYYLSGPDDYLGKIVLEARTLGAGTFFPYVGTTSKATCFNPILPQSGPSASVVSSADELPHGACFSKQNEPEAVPATNFIAMGSAASPVRRILATRDSLFFLKDDGVWRLNGATPDDFTLTQVDANCIPMGAETAATLNGRIYALTLQGVVAISEAGVEIVSRPIEADLLSLMAATSYRGVLESYAWGVGYESDHTYMLGVPTSASANTCATTYVYNEATDAWTTDTKPALCAHVKPDVDLLHLGNFVASDGYVYQERKTRTINDYVDGTNTAIASVIEFAPDAAGMPGVAKHWQEAAILFASGSGQRASGTVTFANTFGSASVPLSPLTPLARLTVPMVCRRSERLKVAIAITSKQTAWQVLGVSVFFEPYGRRTNT